MAGAFDGFPNAHRAQYFYRENETAPIFIESILKHGAMVQEKKNSPQVSLFGEMEEGFDVLDPVLPETKPWSLIHKLRLEKEVTGFYISGHPLDEFKLTMERYCTIELNDLKNNLEKLDKKKIKFAGMITESQQKTSKKGSPFGIFTLEDYSGSMSLMIFNEEYLKRKHLLEEGNNVFITATVEERFNQSGYYDVRISDISLLSEAMNKLAKTITVNIDAVDIDEDLIRKLAQTAKENSGTCILRIKVKDTDSGDSLTMKTVKLKIEPRSFILALKNLTNLSYSIN
jgi:DNA polymerase-3 subunit alpha